MIKDKILTYSFETLADISVDIQKRNYYYKKVSHILQKKCELDINYSNSIDNLIVKQNHRVIHEEIPSQFLYATIIELIQEETKRIRLFAESLKYQIIKMISQYDKESSQIKKSLMLSHSINKDIISQKEKLQKSKHRFQKKNKELQQSKVEYLVSFLNSEQLQKKNSFYLTVNGLEEAIKPLKDDYEDLTNKFNELIEVNMEQINSILTKIELVEYKKINAMKNVVNTYLKNQKKLIDQTLRCNPFRIANVDSVREVNEFKVHTEEDLLNQKERLLIPYSNEAAFINRIYDRMQIKKNLPQIILYGQTRQYRLEITRIFNKQAILQIPKLSPKTIRIIDIFRQIFQGQIHENIFEQLKSLLIKQQMIRKDFTICLQKYRINNQFQLQFRNKDNILKSLNIFLDIVLLLSMLVPSGIRYLQLQNVDDIGLYLSLPAQLVEDRIAGIDQVSSDLETIGVVAGRSALEYILGDQGEDKEGGTYYQYMGYQGWRDQQKVGRVGIDSSAYMLQSAHILRPKYESLSARAQNNISICQVEYQSLEILREIRKRHSRNMSQNKYSGKFYLLRP